MICDYADDCVHLKACRRLCVIAENELHKKLVRGCSDKCNAYETEDALIGRVGAYTRQDLEKVMRGVTYDVECGYTDNMIEDYL